MCGIPREIAQPFQIARETLLDYDGLDFATEVTSHNCLVGPVDEVLVLSLK